MAELELDDVPSTGPRLRYSHNDAILLQGHLSFEISRTGLIYYGSETVSGLTSSIHRLELPEHLYHKYYSLLHINHA